MRIARQEWPDLDPDDVAWVVEWQLSEAFSWVPIGEESPVSARPAPEPDRSSWRAAIRAGGSSAEVRLPLRDLARVVRWCHTVNRAQLRRPPASVRASLLALRRALARGFSRFDPLAFMGYHHDPVAER